MVLSAAVPGFYCEATRVFELLYEFYLLLVESVPDDLLDEETRRFTDALD